MTTPIALTHSEKEHLTKWLSRKAMIGGGTFIGLAVVPLIVMLVVSFLNPNDITYSVETLIAIFALPVGMIGVGAWLIGRRRAVRRWFDEPLALGHGRILTIHPPTDGGSSLTLEIINEFGEGVEAQMRYIGKPDWQVGDEIELIVWKNGRFCPRHFDHMVDVSYLPTPERTRRSKIWGTIIMVVFISLLGIGILIGIMSQG